MLVRPFGSVYVRAQTEAYGASNDCIPGGISVVDTAVTAGQAGLLFGDVEFDPNGEPDLDVGDPATPGYYTNQNGRQKARGVRGRFGFDFQGADVLAVAPLMIPDPVPTPTPIPVPRVIPTPQPQPQVIAIAIASKASMKATKAGNIALTLSNPNAASVSYRASAKTVSKYKLGKSKARKVISVAASRTVTLKSGESAVRLRLSSAGKKLLKQRKSVKVELTLTPSSGGKAVTKTITLRRS
jgi:hypothetical protein